jgi:hypothetical protein
MVTGVFVPIVAAVIAAVPVWIGVIQPWIDRDGDDDPKPTPTSTFESAGQDFPSDAALLAALVQPEELPPDYVVTEAIVEEPCGLHITRRGVVGRSRAYRFGPESDPYIYHEVSVFYPGDATATLDEAIATIDGCSTTQASSATRATPSGKSCRERRTPIRSIPSTSGSVRASAFWS